MATNKNPPGVTRAAVQKLWDDGLTPREIARELDIATQAVYQHLEAIRAEEKDA